MSGAAKGSGLVLWFALRPEVPASSIVTLL